MSLSAAAKNLDKIFRQHGVTVTITDKMLEQFARFHKFLAEYNKKYNLTRLTSFDDVAVKHFVDCIYVAQLTEIPDRLLDLGSGAGFPGVPLKIVLPQKRIFLAEGVQKKVAFLKELRDHLELKGLDIIGKNIDAKTQYPVNGVITRAVELAADTLQNVSNCLQRSGRVFLMKTPGIDAELKDAREKMGHLFKLVETLDYRLGPSTHKRTLVIFEKTSPSEKER